MLLSVLLFVYKWAQKLVGLYYSLPSNFIALPLFPSFQQFLNQHSHLLQCLVIIIVLLFVYKWTGEPVGLSIIQFFLTLLLFLPLFPSSFTTHIFLSNTHHVPYDLTTVLHLTSHSLLSVSPYPTSPTSSLHCCSPSLSTTHATYNTQYIHTPQAATPPPPPPPQRLHLATQAHSPHK